AYDGLIRAEPAPKTPVPASVKPADRSGPIPRPVTGASTPISPTQPTRATQKTAPIARPLTERVAAQPKPEPPPAQAPQTPQSEEQRFAGALDLLRRHQWRDAERSLGELAVAVPTDKRFR